MIDSVARLADRDPRPPRQAGSSPDSLDARKSQSLEIRLWPFHFKEIGAAAIMIAAEAGDRLELAGIDLPLGVEDSIFDVNQEHLTDDQVGGYRAIAERDELKDAALEMHRRLR